MKLGIKLSFISFFALLTVSVWAQEESTTEVVKETPVIVPNVNTDNTEFAPTISADGNLLIFQSGTIDTKWELFQSEKEEGGSWSNPKPIDKINDACDFIGGPNLSFDGNTLYYTAFIEGVTES